MVVGEVAEEDRTSDENDLSAEFTPLILHKHGQGVAEAETRSAIDAICRSMLTKERIEPK